MKRPLRPGGRECECSACGQRFASPAGFTAHRRNDACLTARQMRAAGWPKDKQGRWLLPKKEEHDH